jgi:hypothetical protein
MLIHAKEQQFYISINRSNHVRQTTERSNPYTRAVNKHTPKSCHAPFRRGKENVVMIDVMWFKKG